MHLLKRFGNVLKSGQGFLVIFSLIAFIAIQSRAALPAFPGAEGYGAAATGGRGGALYHVTTLSDAGAGSFRDAVSVANRIVVFDVGGYINLSIPVHISNNITIAGQTAPGDGIALFGQAVSASSSSNIIVRYIRIRQGLAANHHDSSLKITSGSNMIFDHVSIEWGRWDCIDMSGSSNITFQNCIIGEGINEQNFGCLCESDFVTFSHNLWIDNQSRNPKAKGQIQFVNNVVYNWGGATGFVGGHSAADHYADIVNNYFIAGPSSAAAFVGQFTATDKVYESGNVYDNNLDGALNGRAVVQADYTDSGGSPTFLSAPTFAPPIPVATSTAAQAALQVIANSGANLHRDSVDARLVGYAQTLGTAGQIIDDPATVGGNGTLRNGTPPIDADHDGMPDAWESANGLNPLSAADGSSSFGTSGYLNVEGYINSLGQSISDGPHVFVNRKSGLAADDFGNSTTQGAIVDQATLTGAAAQSWFVTNVGVNDLSLTNLRSGFVMEVYQASKANGGLIDQWTWNGANNKTWHAEFLNGGYYKLTNKNSNLVLETPGSSTAPGIQLDQWTWNAGSNQQWQVR